MLKRAVCLLVAAGVMAAAQAVAAVEQPQNVILIAWDRAPRDHLHECLGRGELPNLQKLIDNGAYVDIEIEGIADTKAGWSQILTGYYPETTGVYSNSRYGPIPKGLSIFERLERHFGTDDFVTVAVIGRKQHLGEINPPKKVRLDSEDDEKNKTTQGEIVEEDGVKYRLIPGSPYCNMYTALDVWEFGLRDDENVGTRTNRLLEKYRDKPFFFFVHFAQVDHSGHQLAQNSETYNDALMSNDRWTGKIMDKTRELGLAEKTQFYITTDHGLNEDANDHNPAPHVFLATNNARVIRDGRRQDVAPTILEAFGLDVSKIEPPLDGISLTKPDDRLAAETGAEQATEAVETNRIPDVIFVPTPQDVVEEMLELVELKKDDLVYDLGCGDGRIVVTAARKYGCRGVGYDIDPERIKESLENVGKNNVGDLVQIKQKDIFTLDLSDANVITLYLLPSLNVKLIPQLEKLKPGSRIVSHDFDMRGVQPDKVIKVMSDEDNREHSVYMWTSPLKKVSDEEPSDFENY